MAIEKMKRVKLAAPRPRLDELLISLQWMGQLEISPFATDSPDGEAALMRDNSAAEAEIERHSAQIKRLGEAIGILAKYKVKQKNSLLPKLDEVERRELAVVQNNADTAAAGAITLYSELTSAKVEAARLKEKIAALSPWRSYGGDTSDSIGHSVIRYFGTLPIKIDINTLAPSCGLCFEKVRADGTAGVQYAAAYIYAPDKSDADAALAEMGFIRIDLSAVEGGSPAEALERAKSASDALRGYQKDREDDLAQIGAEAGAVLKTAYDAAVCARERSRAKRNLLTTENAAVLTGWLPERETQRFEKIADEYGCYYRLEEPEPTDDVPTKLKNGVFSEKFHGVLDMYSLPKYGSFDPTRIMMISYFVIFGLMLGDVVYGLLLLLGGLFVYKKSDLARSTKNLVGMFAVCGVACIISGAVFGSYLGDLPSQIAKNFFGRDLGKSYYLVDTMDGSGPLIFLVISLAAGVLHLMTGIGIKIYISFRRREVGEIIKHCGWFALFADLILIALGAAKIAPIPVAVQIAVAAVAAAAIMTGSGFGKKGVVGKITGALGGIYGVIGYASDLLSYSRIMALGLASAVIASVFNTLATLVHTPVLNWVFMILIAVIGHSLNLAINIIGSFVHTNRLHYIEFFSRFYEDEGRAFAPLEMKLKYTKIKNQ